MNPEGEGNQKRYAFNCSGKGRLDYSCLWGITTILEKFCFKTTADNELFNAQIQITAIKKGQMHREKRKHITNTDTNQCLCRRKAILDLYSAVSVSLLTRSPSQQQQFWVELGLSLTGASYAGTADITALWSLSPYYRLSCSWSGYQTGTVYSLSFYNKQANKNRL